MIIYTVITEENCPVPDQEVIDSRFKYICLHSVEVEKKYPWTYVKIKKENNELYTYAKYKILCPFEESFFVDAKLVFTNTFYQICENFYHYDIVVNKHPYRTSFLDEVVDWLILPVFRYEDAIEYIQDVKNMGYPFMSGNACLTNLMYRKNANDFNRVWWMNWLQFKKRNQLSFYLADFYTSKKVLYTAQDCVRVFKHQPPRWTNSEMREYNLKKLVCFQKDLQKMNIEYKFNYEALLTRGFNFVV